MCCSNLSYIKASFGCSGILFVQHNLLSQTYLHSLMIGGKKYIVYLHMKTHLYGAYKPFQDVKQIYVRVVLMLDSSLTFYTTAKLNK